MNYAELPTIDENDLDDIFSLETINESYRKNNFTVYKYNDELCVPRVSQILKETIGKEYLVNWAAKIGYNKMIFIREKATTIGSQVHELIDNWLLTRTDGEFNSDFPESYKIDASRAYNNFKDWEKYINSQGYFIEEVVAVEKPVVCTLYGGTIDAIVKINGKYYIVDFKTSKKISHEYIAQACSYMWIVNNIYYHSALYFDLPYIDGIGIIRIDKSKNEFEDLFLNLNNDYQRQIIESYYRGFGALLSSFYNNINMSRLFEEFTQKQFINKTTLDLGE